MIGWIVAVEMAGVRFAGAAVIMELAIITELRVRLALAAYAGLAPVPHDSGKRTGNLQRPRRYNRRLRHAFYMAALSSIRDDGPNHAYYHRKRQEGRRQG